MQDLQHCQGLSHREAQFKCLFSTPLFCPLVVSLGAHMEITEKDKTTLICYQLEEMRKLFSNLWLWSIRLKTPREVIGIITPAPDYFCYALEIRERLCPLWIICLGAEGLYRHRSYGHESRFYPGCAWALCSWHSALGQVQGHERSKRAVIPVILPAT